MPRARHRALTAIDKLDWWCEQKGGLTPYQFALSGPGMPPPNWAWVPIGVAIRCRAPDGGEDRFHGVKMKADPATAQATLDEIARLYRERGLEQVTDFQASAKP